MLHSSEIAVFNMSAVIFHNTFKTTTPLVEMFVSWCRLVCNYMVLVAGYWLHCFGRWSLFECWPAQLCAQSISNTIAEYIKCSDSLRWLHSVSAHHGRLSWHISSKPACSSRGMMTKLIHVVESLTAITDIIYIHRYTHRHFYYVEECSSLCQF